MVKNFTMPVLPFQVPPNVFHEISNQIEWWGCKKAGIWEETILNDPNQ